MQAYIFEPDRNLQQYYTNLLSGELRGLNLSFFSELDELRRRIAESPCDLVITETDLAGASVIDLITELSAKQIPVLIVSEDCGERLIVECLKAGAIDFLSKRNIKLGFLPDAIRRALLEADRWGEIQAMLSRMPARPEYIKLSQVLRSGIQLEQAEIRRARLKNKEDGAGLYQEGKTYDLAFLFLQIAFPESLTRSADEQKASRVMNEVVQQFVNIAVRYGGDPWVRRRDGGIFAYPAKQCFSALLASIEIRALMNMINISTENMHESIQATMGLASGMTIYRENIGDIHSDALNHAAHLAIQYSRRNTILISGNMRDHIGDRARKYFFKGEDFEGREIYFFERVV